VPHGGNRTKRKKKAKSGESRLAFKSLRKKNNQISVQRAGLPGFSSGQYVSSRLKGGTGRTKTLYEGGQRLSKVKKILLLTGSPKENWLHISMSSPGGEGKDSIRTTEIAQAKAVSSVKRGFRGLPGCGKLKGPGYKDVVTQREEGSAETAGDDHQRSGLKSDAAAGNTPKAGRSCLSLFTKTEGKGSEWFIHRLDPGINRTTSKLHHLLWAGGGALGTKDRQRPNPIKRFKGKNSALLCTVGTVVGKLWDLVPGWGGT